MPPADSRCPRGGREIRRPKSEARKKAETQNPRGTQSNTRPLRRGGSHSDFSHRASFGFGPRISDLAHRFPPRPSSYSPGLSRALGWPVGRNHPQSRWLTPPLPHHYPKIARAFPRVVNGQRPACASDLRAGDPTARGRWRWLVAEGAPSSGSTGRLEVRPPALPPLRGFAAADKFPPRSGRRC